MQHTITKFEVQDIRFPTSKGSIGSDAMNQDPDYSAAYLIIHTDANDGLEGHGLTFTIGRGNDICLSAIKAYEPLLVGRHLEEFTSDMGKFWKNLMSDSQLRWLGPEKGVMHLAAGAVINAIWDLWAKCENKPVWRLVADMSPEELIRCIDFTYITDAISQEEALSILRKAAETKNDRIKELLENGYPAYTTSIGWLGYSDEKITRLCHEALDEGWTSMKMKIGGNIKRDKERAKLIREIIGYENHLMMDANQVWDVDEAINYCQELTDYKPYWIEEPTSPDDILGHKKIAEAINPIRVATGEHCQNRMMFKQFITSGALQICQIDSCRLAGVNENLAVLLLAAKYEIPVCPHAGGVGLCEYVQHLSMIDYLCISANKEGRMIEYVDHLHEHFEDPVRIKRAHYMPPRLPGYSIEMKEASRKEFEYPNGEYWKKEKAKMSN